MLDCGEPLRHIVTALLLNLEPRSVAAFHQHSAAAAALQGAHRAVGEVRKRVIISGSSIQ